MFPCSRSAWPSPPCIAIGAVPLVGEQQGHGDDPHEGALAIDVGPREVTRQKLGDVHSEPVESGQQIEAQPIGRAGELVEGHTDLDMVPEAGEDAQAVEEKHPLCEHLAAEDPLGEDPEDSAGRVETTTLISEQYGHPPYRVADPGQRSSKLVSPAHLLISTFPKDTSPELAATVDLEPQLAEDGDKASSGDPEGAVDDHMIQDTLVVVEDPCSEREMTSLLLNGVIAEAAVSVAETEFLDTGQVGYVTVEDPCSQREVLSLVQRGPMVMGVTVTEPSMPMENADMLVEQPIGGIISGGDKSNERDLYMHLQVDMEMQLTAEYIKGGGSDRRTPAPHGVVRDPTSVTDTKGGGSDRRTPAPHGMLQNLATEIAETRLLEYREEVPTQITSSMWKSVDTGNPSVEEQGLVGVMGPGNQVETTEDLDHRVENLLHSDRNLMTEEGKNLTGGLVKSIVNIATTDTVIVGQEASKDRLAQDIPVRGTPRIILSLEGFPPGEAEPGRPPEPVAPLHTLNERDEDGTGDGVSPGDLGVAHDKNSPSKNLCPGSRAKHRLLSFICLLLLCLMTAGGAYRSRSHLGQKREYSESELLLNQITAKIWILDLSLIHI